MPPKTKKGSVAGGRAVSRKNPAPPNSWFSLLLSTSLLLTATVICLALYLYFVQTRPVDLRKYTASLIEQTSQLLISERQLTSEQIKQSNKRESNDSSALWTYAEFDVALPANVRSAGIQSFLVERLTKLNVAVAADAAGAEAPALRCLFADREFLVIRLSGGVQTSEENRNLTEACNRISAEVAEILKGYLAAGAMLDAKSPVSKQEGGIVWTFSVLDADVSSAAQVGSAIAAIREKMAGRDVEITPPQSDTTTTTIRVIYSGVECMELIFHLGDGAGTPSLPVIQLPTLSIPNEAVKSIAPEGAEPMPSLESESAGADEPPVIEERPGRSTDGTVRVAVVLDDGGRDGAAADAILAMDTRLTLAVLPFEPNSRAIVERAKKLGFEVILHMPMEAEGNHRGYPNSITTAMSREQIREMTDNALDQTPGVVGINNHQGSKFTSDANAMRSFLEDIESRQLYFLDSRTLATTVAYSTARELGVPTNYRDVFLDNKSSIEHIRVQFDKLIASAKKQTVAIGICHFREETARALAECLPKLEKEGIRLVHASELMQ